MIARLRRLRAALRAHREHDAAAEPQPADRQDAVGGVSSQQQAGPDSPAQREVGASPGAEAITAALWGLSGLAGAGFVMAYALHGSTQLLGATLAAALALASAGLIVAGRAVAPRETAVEDRRRFERDEERDSAEPPARLLSAGTEGVSRRRLLGAAAGVAGGGLAGALAAPVASLGPRVDHQLGGSPWHPGRPLVDERGRALRADDVTVGGFLTAFPKGADPRELGSPVVLVRVEPGALRLPREREGWAPEGLLAFSKICTHAGCAIALYRAPLNQQTSKSPALVCPCHYSTFDVLRAAAVQFGPAGRPLPQLPLAIGADRALLAAGPLSGAVGPAWWGVRR